MTFPCFLGGRESPASGRGNTNDEGWNQVQSKNSRSVPQPVDPSRLKLSRVRISYLFLLFPCYHHDLCLLQLGPCSY